MKKQYICEGWTLSGAGYKDISATVPGCVHTDLLAAGHIEDMYWRNNSEKIQWIENEDWTYTCHFDAVADDGAELIFEGLDTYADVYLNGCHIGSSDNMFIPHSFAVGKHLCDGENTLEVRFRSPILEVADAPRPNGAFTRERMNTRRMQCTYSWDWVDRFVTMGIFRPVYISYPNGIDLESLYVYTEGVDEYSAQLYTKFYFNNYDTPDIARVEIFAPSGEVVARYGFYADRPETVRRVDIKDPELWYPVGYGAQPLYTIRVSVGENCHEQRFGIRTLKILQLADEVDSEYYDIAKAAQDAPHGRMFDHNEGFSGFQVIVNGVRVLCKGGNWVPCEPFPSAESDEKITLLVERAREMGANFLRVWGGGIFEKAAFYDTCDRLGILVAQDFLMACGTYPEKEEWFIDALKRESEYAVKYLRNHPCLAWWHGDNENATEGSDTQSDYIGRDSALRGIADNIYKYDWSRQFLPSSPYGGNTYGSVTVGTTHTTNFLGLIFDYFNTSDCTDYKEHLGGFNARFISEEGVFGAVTRPSMLKFLEECDLVGDSEEMLEFHTKSNPALPVSIYHSVTSFAKKAFGAPKDGEDRFFKYKYMQCEWVRLAFEACKRNIGYCNGLIFWMFNDCWPAALGWAFVDYYCLPKPAFYTFKRLARSVSASIVSEDGGLKLCVSCDNDSYADFRARVRVFDINGMQKIDSVDMKGTVWGYSCERIDIPFAPEEDRVYIADVEYKDGRDRCFYKKGLLEIVPCKSGIQILERGENFVRLRAKEYVHILELEGQYIFSENYFALLSGEEKTVYFREFENTTGTDFTITAYTLLK